MPQNPYLRDASGVPDWQLCGFCGQEHERFLDRFVFALPCAAGAKIPSRATQQVAAGAASASRHCPAAHKAAGYETDQKPCFGALFSLRLYRQVESLRCANARRRLGATGRTRTADLLITNQLLYQLSHSSKYFFLLPTLGKKCRASNSFYIINRTFCFCKPFLKNL